MDFGTSLMFLVLVAIALYFRRRPEIHKRVMVLACCSILLPAIGRIPFTGNRVLFAHWGFGDLSPSQRSRHLRAFFTTRSNTADCILRTGGAVLCFCRLSRRSCWLAPASLWLKFTSWLLSR